ncbi:hypothetical protein HRbin12_00892 [bacterium HR12]|nr:hypothetical protein HRbin12_00892 [bacterium HR12]
MGIASTTDDATATITWLRVSMEMSHIPTRPTPAMHEKLSTVRPGRRDTFHAATAAAPATIHHGTPRSRSRRGSRPKRIIEAVMASVTSLTCRVSQATARFTGSEIERAHVEGKSCCRNTSRPTSTAALEPTTITAHGAHRGSARAPIRSRLAPRRRRSRSPHPIVTRSSTMARRTMAMPPARASPTSRRWRAL